jgi:4-hydroxy-2-oxoheptanedioate aldolase
MSAPPSSSHAAGFRARVLAGEWLAGAWLNLGSALTAEIAARAGFDWVLFDQEHGPGGEETLLHQLHAVSGALAAPFVRIAANEPPRFKRALDLGAQGLMVPYVNSEDEARAAVAAFRYPPRGMRGVSKFNRSAGFGFDFDDTYAHAHERQVLIAQIETPEAVAAADAIARVDGVDVLFIGPLDLTANLGAPGNFDLPIFVEARKRVVAAARASGKATGILLGNPAHVPLVRAEGFTFVALGSDGGAVASGLRQILGQLRGKA